MGIDASLTSTGVAYRGILSDYIETQIQNHLKYAKPDMVMLEGYSFQSKFNREQMGELGGIVRLACWRAHVDVTLVPPTTLKKAMIGNAGTGATKTSMQKALLDKFGYEIKQDDEADAMALLLLGEASYLGLHLDMPVDLTTLNECEILRGMQFVADIK